MDKHAISIKWSDQDNCYVATIPGILALSAFGTTREEALAELKIAAEAYFEALEAAGKTLPLPDKVTPYSGQLRLRMPRSLHATLSHEAEDENLSLNTYIVTLLSERHNDRKLLNEIKSLERMAGATRPDKFSSAAERLRTASKVEETGRKYRGKKQER